MSGGSGIEQLFIMTDEVRSRGEDVKKGFGVVRDKEVKVWGWWSLTTNTNTWHYVERVVPLEGQGSELVEGGYRLWFSFLKVPWFIVGDETRGRGNI